MVTRPVVSVSPQPSMMVKTACRSRSRIPARRPARLQAIAVALAAANSRWWPSASACSRAAAATFSNTLGTASRIVGRKADSSAGSSPGSPREADPLAGVHQAQATTQARMCDSGRKNKLEEPSVSTRSRTPGTPVMARTAGELTSNRSGKRVVGQRELPGDHAAAPSPPWSRRDSCGVVELNGISSSPETHRAPAGAAQARTPAAEGMGSRGRGGIRGMTLGS
jgi:hypothetical protein